MISTLTDEQKRAADLIKEFLSRPPKPGEFFCLAGPPGSGKTFMLKEALRHETKKIVGGTIAHSAKDVLSESIPTSFTVAQLLGYSIDMESPEIAFKQQKAKPKMDEAQVLVIDEASMIDDEIADKIIAGAAINGIHLIVVGDPDQLPPVKQSRVSKFFKKIDAELTTSKRFEGPIGELAMRIRTEIRKIHNDEPFDKYIFDSEYHRENCVRGDTGFIFMNSIHAMVDAAVKDIVEHPEDKHYARILAYKNSTIALLNQGVRSRIYGNNAKQFEAGELVISNGGFSESAKARINNGLISRVIATKEALGPFNVPCVYLKLDNVSTFERGIPVVQNTPEAKIIYEHIRMEKYKNGIEYDQWKEYNKFLQSFAVFDYAYATSLYKAQGMTLTNVYVCEGEIMDVKPIEWQQRFQALYVAMTRARKKLIIYNKHG